MMVHQKVLSQLVWRWLYKSLILLLSSNQGAKIWQRIVCPDVNEQNVTVRAGVGQATRVVVNCHFTVMIWRLFCYVYYASDGDCQNPWTGGADGLPHIVAAVSVFWWGRMSRLHVDLPTG